VRIVAQRLADTELRARTGVDTYRPVVEHFLRLGLGGRFGLPRERLAVFGHDRGLGCDWHVATHQVRATSGDGDLLVSVMRCALLSRCPCLVDGSSIYLTRQHNMEIVVSANTNEITVLSLFLS
jgi:hypothetical protein